MPKRGATARRPRTKGLHLGALASCVIPAIVQAGWQSSKKPQYSYHWANSLCRSCPEDCQVCCKPNVLTIVWNASAKGEITGRRNTATEPRSDETAVTCTTITGMSGATTTMTGGNAILHVKTDYRRAAAHPPLLLWAELPETERKSVTGRSHDSSLPAGLGLVQFARAPFAAFDQPLLCT